VSAHDCYCPSHHSKSPACQFVKDVRHWELKCRDLEAQLAAVTPPPGSIVMPMDAYKAALAAERALGRLAALEEAAKVAEHWCHGDKSADKTFVRMTARAIAHAIRALAAVEGDSKLPTNSQRLFTLEQVERLARVAFDETEDFREWGLEFGPNLLAALTEGKPAPRLFTWEDVATSVMAVSISDPDWSLDDLWENLEGK
jgi:hypothetical protein